jgi:tetratricopeptide (TPR) repeat protein
MSSRAEEININEKINLFVQKNRKAILIGIGVIVLAVAGFIAALGIVEALRNKALGAVEDLNTRYEALRFSINEESSAGDIEALLEDLNAFAGKNSGYSGGRAFSIIAAIHADKKDWPLAEEAWNKAAKAAAKTYLEPVSLFNAGRAAEEQGNIDKAIEYFTNCAAVSFPAAARAQFSIGRLEEGRNNTGAAIEAYRLVIGKFPNDNVWPNLAQSRIISLQSGNAK